MNLLRMIFPYKHQGMWVFDDERVGLKQEPFISGSDVIISRMVENIPHAENGFILIFSDSQFPDYQFSLEWQREEYRGNWYSCPEFGLQGWLCPAMFHYFEQTPKIIFVLCKPRAMENV